MVGREGTKGMYLTCQGVLKVFLQKLPARVAELPVLVVRRHGAGFCPYCVPVKMAQFRPGQPRC